MDKKQLDIKSDTYFSLFCFIISVILLATTIYRAAVMGITIDEALTSIFYTNNGLFYMFTNLEEQGMIANNHMLNSFFITLFHTIFNV
ncbi:MAG: hypothetical protein K5666_00510, partial [Bacilli bacterium]|nr:hypothetical protein [Bacilli bacterium]